MKRVFVADNQDTTRVSADDFADTIAAAALQQAEDFAPAWSADPAAVTAFPPAPTIAGQGSLIIPATFRIWRPGDPDGAVAWHDVDPTTKEPRVTLLTDVVASLPVAFLIALATAFTHEVLECLDFFADEWVDLPDGRQEARELCDRTQNASYAKKVYRPDGTMREMQVSDFLMPDGFALVPTGEKADFMDLLPRDQPRSILGDKGDGNGAGYQIVRSRDGAESQVDGDHRAALRYSSGALARRGVNVAAVRAKLAGSKR